MIDFKYEVVKTMVCGKMVKVHWKPDPINTLDLINKGSIPIEMADGTKSYVDFRQLDHHNQFIDNPAACQIALQYYNDCKQNGGSFIVNHIDLDCVATGAILLGLIPRDQVDEFVKWAALDDIDPLNPILHQDPTPEMLKKIRIWKYMIGGPKNTGWAWIHGLTMLSDLFENPNHWEKNIIGLERKEAHRKVIAIEDYCNRIELDDKRAIFIGPSHVWGFDIQLGRLPDTNYNSVNGWRHHVVMSYVENTGKITIGCPNRTIAEHTFGKGGLSNIYPKLEKFKPTGWGGRITVGGSGRGIRLSLDEAKDCFHYLVDHIMANTA